MTAPQLPSDPTTMLTEEEFIAQYEPERADDNSLYRQRYHYVPADLPAIEQARAEARLWTMCESDGLWHLESGVHTVNRLFHVITKKPHGDASISVVLDNEFDEHELEDDLDDLLED